MKDEILQIAYSLEKGKINEEEAKSEFLDLFNIVKSLVCTGVINHTCKHFSIYTGCSVCTINKYEAK